MGCGLNYNGVEYFYLRDLTKNINSIIDKQGKVIVQYSYTAFGVPSKEIGSLLTSEEESIANVLMEHNIYLYKGYCYDAETGLYYCNSRYYNPEWGRWLNTDDVSYLNPSSVNGLNLYAYCLNNPVMYTDPSGTSPKWWQWVISGASIVGGIALIALTGGLGGIIGGALLAAGANSLISGYINEATGGSFTAGWAGGYVTGFVSGLGAGVGGVLFDAATYAVNFGVLSTVGAAVAVSFGAGFAGSYYGAKITANMDGRAFNKSEALENALINGSLNILAGFGAGIGRAIATAGTTPIYSILATSVAVLTEAIYDLTSYGINKLLEYYNNKNKNRGISSSLKIPRLIC